MKKIIRDYLTFNRRERNGVFVLLVIIVLLIIYMNVAGRLAAPQRVDFTAAARQLDSLAAAQGNGSGTGSEAGEKYPFRESEAKPAAQQAGRFAFDPNTLPESGWRQLGLSDRQIRTIKNYEARGGVFRKKEDLKKMYCIREELYNSLEPYIRIPAESRPPAVFVDAKVVSAKTPETAVTAVIELNDADSAQLTTLRGIGAFYAKTILKYRNSIGGFYAKEQLLEVWKFDADKYAAIEKFITVDPAKIRKLGINSLAAEQLKHPYLSWNMVNAIVNYRKAHGKFKTIDEIKRTDLVDDETLRKIAPYLTLD